MYIPSGKHVQIVESVQIPPGAHAHSMQVTQTLPEETCSEELDHLCGAHIGKHVLLIDHADRLLLYTPAKPVYCRLSR